MGKTFAVQNVTETDEYFKIWLYGDARVPAVANRISIRHVPPLNVRKVGTLDVIPRSDCLTKIRAGMVIAILVPENVSTPMKLGFTSRIVAGASRYKTRSQGTVCKTLSLLFL